jgi:hypothetical protein
MNLMFYIRMVYRGRGTDIMFYITLNCIEIERGGILYLYDILSISLNNQKR